MTRLVQKCCFASTDSISVTSSSIVLSVILHSAPRQRVKQQKQVCSLDQWMISAFLCVDRHIYFATSSHKCRAVYPAQPPNHQSSRFLLRKPTVCWYFTRVYISLTPLIGAEQAGHSPNWRRKIGIQLIRFTTDGRRLIDRTGKSDCLLLIPARRVLILVTSLTGDHSCSLVRDARLNAPTAANIVIPLPTRSYWLSTSFSYYRSSIENRMLK